MQTFSTIGSVVGKVLKSPVTGQVLEYGSSALGGIGQVLEARSIGETGEYNQQVLQQKAEAERTSNALLESQKRKIYKSRIGTQVSLYAKSGIKMTGTPIEVILDSLENAEMDIAIDNYNSQVAAQGLETQGQLIKREAEQQKAKAYARGGSSFLSLASRMYLENRDVLGTKTQTLGKTYGSFKPGTYKPRNIYKG